MDVRDVAHVAAETLIGEKHAGKVYTLTGPVALGIAEVARILSETTGCEINYVDIPEEAARAGMLQAGLPPWLIE